MEKNWTDGLIQNIVDKIRACNIVPIIGPEVFYVEDGKSRISVQQYVVRELFEKKLKVEYTEKEADWYGNAGLKGMTHLDGFFEEKNMTLSNHLYSLFNNPHFTEKIQINRQVLRFLQDGQFPLIISTCRFGLLQKLIKAHGSSYKVIAYNKGKKKEQDIPLNIDTEELSYPTIFHLFGEYSETREVSGVITEDDFLHYLHCLHDTSTRPQLLLQYLSRNRSVFTIGCDIPDWTFRFMLFSLKERDGRLRNENGRSDNFVGGVFMKPFNEDFRDFLFNSRYYPGEMVDEFLEDINNEISPENKPQVFLSLCSNEYDTLGEQLCRILQPRFKVWFFKHDGNPFAYWDSISKGLESSLYILPVMTYQALNKMYGYKPSAHRHDTNPGLVEEWEMAQKLHIKCCPLYVQTLQGDIKEFFNSDNNCSHLRDFFLTSGGNAGINFSLDSSADELYDHLFNHSL